MSDYRQVGWCTLQPAPGGGASMTNIKYYLASSALLASISAFGQFAAVRGLGFDTRFMRIWEFYLGYCEAAFVTGNTSVMQFTLQSD